MGSLWLQVEGGQGREMGHDQSYPLVNEETLFGINLTELTDCRNSSYEVIIMSGKEVIRSWIMVKIGLDKRERAEVELIEQRSSTTGKSSIYIIWQV